MPREALEPDQRVEKLSILDEDGGLAYAARYRDRVEEGDTVLAVATERGLEVRS